MSSPFLTRGALRLLRELLAAEAAERFEDAEIVADGRLCWIGERPTARRTLNQLLRMCLVRACEFGKGVERFTLNEEGRAMARDDQYVPIIVQQLALPLATEAARKLRERNDLKRRCDPKNPLWVESFMIGDPVVSVPGGMGGVVLKVKKLSSRTSYTVRWANNHTGRASGIGLRHALK